MAPAAKLSPLGPFAMMSVGERITGMEEERGSIVVSVVCILCLGRCLLDIGCCAVCYVLL